MSHSISTPSLHEDLLTPRLYPTDLPKAARTNLSEQRQCFEAMPQEMERDDNSDHFDRKTNLGRLAQLTPKQREAYGSDLVRSCLSECSGFLGCQELSRRLASKGRDERSRLFLNRGVLAEGMAINLPSLSSREAITWFPLS